MTIKTRLTRLEKNMIDTQNNNKFDYLLNLSKEVREKILNICLDGKFDEVMRERNLCNDLVEKSAIFSKYAVCTPREALRQIQAGL